MGSAELLLPSVKSLRSAVPVVFHLFADGKQRGVSYLTPGILDLEALVHVPASHPVGSRNGGRGLAPRSEGRARGPLGAEAARPSDF